MATMHNQFTIKEGGLNDDILHVAPDGQQFKGGYKAVLEYYTYANEWGNHKQYRRFKTLETASNYIDKHYNFNGEIFA